MFTVYNLMKFLHVGAVIIWLGGMVALAVLNGRLAREGDATVTRLLSRQNEFFGRAVMGPSALVTLITGVVLMATLGAGFAFWMVWGLAGVFGSVALGAVVVGRAGRELGERSSAERPDEARLRTLRRRVAVGAVLNIVLLFSTVWAMVFKPTL